MPNQPATQLYGPEYYASHLGLPYERAEPHWLRFFGAVAEHILRELKPARVFDLGCAKGFLVEALRDRGVEAWGSDISEYAIGEVRPDLRAFCSVASATEPISGRYDLVTCIEVLEHLSEADGKAAIRNMGAVTDVVLFSSTPADFVEPTHLNVQPVLYWLKLFRDCGFAPDPAFDASFVSPQAVLLRRTRQAVSDEQLFNLALARHIAVETGPLRTEIAQTQAKLANEQHLREQTQRQLGETSAELQRAAQQLQEIAQHVANLESSFGWRLSAAFRRRRERLFPEGTRRRTWTDLTQKGARILLFDGISGLRSAWRKHRQMRAPAQSASYVDWIARHEPSPQELLQQRQQASRFQFQPLVSVVMPVYNPDLAILQEAVRSLAAQTYGNWELCAAGSASAEVAAELSRLADSEKRIRLKWLPQNLGISGNSNECLRLAAGEFVTFLDQDDVLSPFAFYEVVKRLNFQPDLDFIYTDKDLLAADGSKRFSPLFKPEWSPEIMLSANYLAHMSVIRRELIERAGAFRPEFDGAQDWDLFLRVLSLTDRIGHVPVVAYHWRELPSSAASGIKAKPYAQQKQLEVVTSHLQRAGLQATAALAPSGPLRVTWPVSGQNLVSIIIPNRDKVGLLRRCIESLTKVTAYKKFEIVVVENGSKEGETFQYYEEIQQQGKSRVVVFDQPFNYSAVNNFGARHAAGSLLLFLNNDTEAIDPEWLEEMVRWAERPEIGAVGAKLLYPDRRIQHAGVVVGLSGFAGHVYSGCREGEWGSFGSSEWYRDFLAVTGACVLVRREVFEKAGGFDERFELCGSDVEFCLRLREHGYRIVYTPFAKVLHHESATRGTAIPAHDFQQSFACYERYLKEGDPYFNPNLSYWHTHPELSERGGQSPLQFCSRFLDQLSVSSAPQTAASEVVVNSRNGTNSGGTSGAQNRKAPRKSGRKAWTTKTWIKRRLTRSRLSRLVPLWLRYSYDAGVLADWLDYSEADIQASQAVNQGSCEKDIGSINWFIPEFEHAAFGGIHTILRFAARFKSVHQVRNRFVIISSAPVSRIAAEISRAFPELADEPIMQLSSLDRVHQVPFADASIATLWVTAYFLLKCNNTSRKFYFIQDCEPLFYPAGSTAAQVEATYRFGFFGIANTRTLKHMYEQRYGGVAEYFDPAIDPAVFHPATTPLVQHKIKIFFYGRPDHPRNAFELGITALKKVKKALGDGVEIVAAGAQWVPRDYGVEGVINNLGLLSYQQTADLYRTCDMGLLLMFTRHPSYIPLELMASGCVVVTNWNPDTSWLMEDNVNCVLARPAASCLADSLTSLARDTERRHRLRLQAIRLVRERYSDWTAPIDEIFEFMRHPQKHSAKVPATVMQQRQ